MSYDMSVRQAARWAEHKGCLFTINKFTGQPDYLYAVYSTAWKGGNRVLCLGGYDKCTAYVNANKGEQIRMECLQSVVEGMDEEAGEAGCYLGVREEGISWEAA